MRAQSPDFPTWMLSFDAHAGTCGRIIVMLVKQAIYTDSSTCCGPSGGKWCRFHFGGLRVTMSAFIGPPLGVNFTGSPEKGTKKAYCLPSLRKPCAVQ